MLVRHKPQWNRHDRRGSAVVPVLNRRSTAGKCQISYLRGGTAETLNMIKTSAVPPRLGQSAVGSPRQGRYRRGTAMTAVVPYKTAVAPPSPQCIRSTTAVQSRKKSRLAIPLRFYCGYGGATTVLPPHRPRSAAANTAVMSPMIAVAPPSNGSCNPMGSPCPQ